MASTYDLQVKFGALPIGTVFERSVWARNTTGDRRRKDLHRWRYQKTSHGTIAGFAQGAQGTWHAEHNWPVYIDSSDFRLVIECARYEGGRS